MRKRDRLKSSLLQKPRSCSVQYSPSPPCPFLRGPCPCPPCPCLPYHPCLPSHDLPCKWTEFHNKTINTRLPRNSWYRSGIQANASFVILYPAPFSPGSAERFAKATYAAIAETYSYLTPDLWKETVFTKSPYQEFTDFLAKNHRTSGVQKKEASAY